VNFVCDGAPFFWPVALGRGETKGTTRIRKQDGLAHLPPRVTENDLHTEKVKGQERTPPNFRFAGSPYPDKPIFPSGLAPPKTETRENKGAEYIEWRRHGHGPTTVQSRIEISAMKALEAGETIGQVALKFEISPKLLDKCWSEWASPGEKQLFFSWRAGEHRSRSVPSIQRSAADAEFERKIGQNGDGERLFKKSPCKHFQDIPARLFLKRRSSIAASGQSCAPPRRSAICP